MEGQAIPERLRAALRCYEAGRWQEAEQICRQIVQADPRQADAWYLLGMLGYQMGQYLGAAHCIGQAIRLRPTAPAFHNGLGICWQAMGQVETALACWRKAVSLQGGFVEGWQNLGMALQGQGKLEEAIACYCRALELEPRAADVHNNLGNALADLGRLEEAVACYRRAVALRPDFAEAQDNLGTALRERGDLQEAVACHQRALAIQGDYAEAHSHLGIALYALGQVNEAVACWRRALALRPDYAEALNNLGIALFGLGEVDESIACCRQAVALKKDYADALSSRGNALGFAGEIEEALVCYRRAMELKPAQPALHSDALYLEQYRAEVSLPHLAELHDQWDRRHAAGLGETGRVGVEDRPVERPLRVGFVSPDFRRHPVGFFFVRALEGLQQQACETVCYAASPRRDDLTARIRAAAGAWREVYSLNDQDLAEQIRRDRIDILFDLAGHTAGNRLLAFARKPAPIQITWIGYEGTTGLAAMDYILADRHMIPPEAERYYRERVLVLPESYVCYDPPDDAPAVAPLPAQAAGEVTFGCFNNPGKVTARTIEAWAKILQRLPKSKLLLKYWGYPSRAVSGRVAGLFAAQGIDASRLHFEGASPWREYLERYGQIDIALDPLPFCGGATTCEAMWMGVPVVSLAGRTFAGRRALSYLSNVGLGELVAADLEGYVDRAVGLASDLERLAALRVGLRQRMADSPLCDGRRLAAHLMQVLWEAWRARAVLV